MPKDTLNGGSMRCSQSETTVAEPSLVGTASMRSGR